MTLSSKEKTQVWMVVIAFSNPPESRRPTLEHDRLWGRLSDTLISKYCADVPVETEASGEILYFASATDGLMSWSNRLF